MTSILDSEAHFEKRSEVVGMSARARQSLITQGIPHLEGWPWVLANLERCGAGVYQICNKRSGCLGDDA